MNAGRRGTKKALTQVNQRCASNLAKVILGGVMVKRFSTQKESILVAGATGTQQNDGYVCGMHAWSRPSVTAIYTVQVHNNFRWYPCQGDKVSGNGLPLLVCKACSGKVHCVLLREGPF